MEHCPGCFARKVRADCFPWNHPETGNSRSGNLRGRLTTRFAPRRRFRIPGLERRFDDSVCAIARAPALDFIARIGSDEFGAAEEQR
jgi:hypothetical protein